MVELLLTDKRIDPQDNTNYCITIACKNNYSKILSLLFKDNRIGSFIELQSAIIYNDILRIKLFLEYGNLNLSYISYLLIRKAWLRGFYEITDFFLNNIKIDLNRLFYNLCKLHKPDTCTGLLNKILNHPRLDINFLIACGFHTRQFKKDQGIKQQLFTHPNLDISKLFKNLHSLGPKIPLEELFVTLYIEGLISLDMITEQNLPKEPVNINELILECYVKKLTLILNEQLLTQLINDNRVNFSLLFESSDFKEISDGLFSELYYNKFISLDCIKENKILSEPSLDLGDQLNHFFENGVLIEELMYSLSMKNADFSI